MPITLIVLLLVFGSGVAAGLPVLLAVVSLVITLGLLYLLTMVTTLSIYVTSTASIIGIGVGIDYALFIVTRYREELAAGVPSRDAVIKSVSTSGRSVAVSGLTVVVALAGMFLVDIQGFRSMADRIDDGGRSGGRGQSDAAARRPRHARPADRELRPAPAAAGSAPGRAAGTCGRCG